MRRERGEGEKGIRGSIFFLSSPVLRLMDFSHGKHHPPDVRDTRYEEARAPRRAIAPRDKAGAWLRSWGGIGRTGVTVGTRGRRGGKIGCQ
jgi:hypothetical protein